MVFQVIVKYTVLPISFRCQYFFQRVILIDHVSAIVRRQGGI
jgi:hypothetical protein